MRKHKGIPVVHAEQQKVNKSISKLYDMPIKLAGSHKLKGFYHVNKGTLRGFTWHNQVIGNVMFGSKVCDVQTGTVIKAQQQPNGVWIGMFNNKPVYRIQLGVWRYA